MSENKKKKKIRGKRKRKEKVVKRKKKEYEINENKFTCLWQLKKGSKMLNMALSVAQIFPLC